MNEVSLDFQLTRRQVWLWYTPFLVIDGVLLVANLFISAGFHLPSFVLQVQLDLHRDDCFATWFSSFQLAVVAGVALANFFVVHRQRSRRWLPLLAWLGMAVLMLALSCDEIAGLHEYVERRQNKIALGTPDAEYVPFIQSWTVWLLPVVVAVVAFILFAGYTCLRHCQTALWLCLAGAGTWVGVVVAEFLQRRLGLEKYSWGYAWRLVWEEGSEIVGATLFLIAFTESLNATMALVARARHADVRKASSVPPKTCVASQAGAKEVHVEKVPTASGTSQPTSLTDAR